MEMVYNKPHMTSIGDSVRWLHSSSPDDVELKELGKSVRLHPLILEELKTPSARAKIEHHKNYLYFIYYFPIFDVQEQVSRRGEIDFIVTKKDVITVTYERIEALEELQTKLASTSFESSLALIHRILLFLFAFEERQLEHIREKVEQISRELFRERERERERTLLQKISYVKRDISQYNIVVRPQKHMLESLAESAGEFFPSSSAVYLNDLVGEHMKIMEQLENYRQAVEDFEATNIQLINLKNAEVTKTFTILAFLTFPMMLFAALFSMDIENTPIVHHPQAFWIILSIMIILMGGMFAYFKRKDWI